MANEFVQYIAGINNSNFHISEADHEIQLWGVRNDQNVSIKGISYHSTEPWSDHSIQNRLWCVVELAKRADIPCLWIGANNVDWRNLEGTVEAGIVEQSNTGLVCDRSDVDVSHSNSDIEGRSELEQYLQTLMGTSLSDYYSLGSHKKEINKSTSPVQEWVRANMPKEFVVIDVDVLVGSGTTPTALVEIRRSNWPSGDQIHGWWPWGSDKRNYYLLAAAAQAAEIEPVLVQHQKSQLDDSDTVGYYTNLGYKQHGYVDGKYPDESDARAWLEFDVDYPTVSEAIQRLESL